MFKDEDIASYFNEVTRNQTTSTSPVLRNLSIGKIPTKYRVSSRNKHKADVELQFWIRKEQIKVKSSKEKK